MWIVDKRVDAILRIVTTRQTSKTISYLNFQYIYEVSCTSTFNLWSIIYSSYFHDWNDNISVKTGYNKHGGNFDHSTQHGLKLTSSVMNLFIPQYLIDCLFLFLSCLFPLTDQVFPGCCPMLVTCCCVTPSLEEVAPLLKYDI